MRSQKEQALSETDPRYATHEQLDVKLEKLSDAMADLDNQCEVDA